MWFRSVFGSPNSRSTGAPARSKKRRARWPRPSGLPLRLERLEDRSLLSTVTVTSTNDSGAGSLREAIADANSGDTIRFAHGLADQTITLTSGELAIDKSLDIEGPGAAELTISGGHTSRVFDISGGATNVEIAGLTIADGWTADAAAVGPYGPVALGGGILNTGAHVSLSRVTMADNHAVGTVAAMPGIASGGAAANIAGGTLDVSHSTFADNQAEGNIRGAGGAILNDNSSLVLDHSTFSGNQAITIFGSAPGIQGNALSGAVYNAGGSSAIVSHNTFEHNSALGGNGANGTATAPNGGNAGTGVGGAVGNEAISLLGPFTPSTMTIDHSTFIDNEAIGGAGGNGAAGGNGGNGSTGGLSVAGGAINNGSSTLTVSHSTFIGNAALGGNGGTGGAGGNGGAGVNGAGGGISSIPTPSTITGGPPVGAALELSDSLFFDNAAIGGIGGNGGAGGNGGNGGAGQGGGLRTGLSDWSVRDSLFAGNQATGGAGGDEGSGGLSGGNGGAGQGGGIINFNHSNGTLADSLLIANEAGGGAGGLGGNGGNGQGGGAYDDATSSLELIATDIVFNQAIGGAAGGGGSAGQGVGGGLYVAPGGVATADKRTVIFGNYATTSDDDVFGVLGA